MSVEMVDRKPKGKFTKRPKANKAHQTVRKLTPRHLIATRVIHLIPRYGLRKTGQEDAGTSVSGGRNCPKVQQVEHAHYVAGKIDAEGEMKVANAINTIQVSRGVEIISDRVGEQYPAVKRHYDKYW